MAIFKVHTRDVPLENDVDLDRLERLIGELKGELEALVEDGALEPFREAEYYLDALAERSAHLPEGDGGRTR